MYHFSYFKEKDQQTILDFLEEYPFAFVTGSFKSGELVATQVPLMVEQRDGELYLQGHIMRNTDHHNALLENPKAMVVFTGPNCYVSASWYSNPHIGSTWNYMSVHIHGSVRFMTNEQLEECMMRLTLKYEQGNIESPTFYTNLPQTFTSKMMPAIAGFEIKVEKMDNVFKLSQNRDEESYDAIVHRLMQRGGYSAMIASEMMKRRAALFPEGTQWDSSKFDS